MLIKFLNGPKKDQTAHVPRDASTQLLIDAGLVAEVREPGPTAEPGVVLHGSQHICPPFVQEITWGVRPLSNSFDARPCVLKQHLSSFTWYALPPDDCPKEIAEKFKAALKHWEGTRRANAHARQKAEDERARSV